MRERIAVTGCRINAVSGFIHGQCRSGAANADAWAVIFNNNIQRRRCCRTMVVGNAGRNGEVKDVFYAVIRMIHRTI